MDNRLRIIMLRGPQRLPYSIIAPESCNVSLESVRNGKQKCEFIEYARQRSFMEYPPDSAEAAEFVKVAQTNGYKEIQPENFECLNRTIPEQIEFEKNNPDPYIINPYVMGDNIFQDGNYDLRDVYILGDKEKNRRREKTELPLGLARAVCGRGCRGCN